jgi:hypothetical protein
VPRETVYEIILAAVRFVGDHDDVAALREDRMPIAFIFREELLNRGEHHAPGGNGELCAQIGPVGSLHRRLAKQITASRECTEELIIEIVAVGEYDYGRVFHCRVQDHAPRVECHGQALARALCVPDHADASVTGVAAGLAACLVAARRFCGFERPSRPKRFLNRHVDRVELVITCHFLGQLPAAHVFEDDEVPQQIKEATLLEDTFQDHL